jgi:hypothetical protein
MKWVQFEDEQPPSGITFLCKDDISDFVCMGCFLKEEEDCHESLYLLSFDPIPVDEVMTHWCYIE